VELGLAELVEGPRKEVVSVFPALENGRERHRREAVGEEAEDGVGVLEGGVYVLRERRGRRGVTHCEDVVNQSRMSRRPGTLLAAFASHSRQCTNFFTFLSFTFKFYGRKSASELR
jgi:hypothetical protein